uniref:Uncharacterized protein n=1 Tax=Candidatus Kentrum sp. TC TaxID=2126339 RepID=A0A450Y837_9GAMM|nr:MAG: hypothetical protein BECKTC1821D_GA0114238_100158 [Candidatus Kentron sp. TC]VFK37696.1 MAG: hypothetical protein BECKTC1821E_GA0114239_100163 [Candidatus Kentron sp. TC]VFK51500.1 MAG: hypothetical protein BECKTC1821F_GA0114240_1001115 [Candidatus Kentron sp. TC]
MDDSRLIMDGGKAFIMEVKTVMVWLPAMALVSSPGNFSLQENPWVKQCSRGAGLV